MMLLAIVAFSQETVTVKGRVLDFSGQPVIGAAVVESGTTNGAITDIDGNYTIKVPMGATLQVSFIGYEESEMVVTSDEVNFTLFEEYNELEELVVVGYGVQKKSDVTGAMSRLDEDEIKSMPVKNALEAMQGRTAGVDITTNQRPGEVAGIQIRGVRSISASSSPLYVVDGMVIQNGSIDNIAASDIESIDILKDASATAIYGSRGANGVVMITTKRGKQGRTAINYTGTVTIERIHNVSKMMNAAEWLEYARHAYNNSGNYQYADGFVPSYGSDQNVFGGVASSWANIEKAWVGGTFHPELVGSYDWESEGKRTGYTQEHNLSVSGGNDMFSGYTSFGYLKQKGSQPGQGYERYTMKTSFEVTPLPVFTMGSSALLSYAVQDYGNNTFVNSGSSTVGDIYSKMRSMIPWTMPYDAEGNFVEMPASGINDEKNPINENSYTTNRRNTFRVNGNIYASLDFGKITEVVKGLSYRIQFGPEFRYYNAGLANAAEGIIGDNNNVAQYTTTKNRSWTLDNLLYYNRTFSESHNVKLTFMQSASRYHQESQTVKSNNVATSDELWYNIGSGGAANLAALTGSSLTERQMASYMIRLNYDYEGKYLLTASLRWDGASQLSDGKKWDTFPSVAAGWRIDQEKFMHATWISNLKLRLGVGSTGNAAISAYATKGGIQNVRYNWGTGESVMGYVASVPTPLSKVTTPMANQDLGWERTTQVNLGLDFGFFNNRLNGSFDFFKTRTKDLLLKMSLPSLTGYTSTYANVGETSGWGIDLQIGGVPVKVAGFAWESNLTWSMDRDKIEKLANGKDEDISNNWFVGKEIGVYYDYVYDGIWKTSEKEEAEKYGFGPGQIRVKDTNGDGMINDDDKDIVGLVRPRWTAGWTNTFSYKNIDLSCFIVSRWDFTVKQGGERLTGQYGQRKVDYWVAGENEDARYPAPGLATEYYAASSPSRAHSLSYQDGSFIKMRNISLAYTFTDKNRWVSRAGIQNMKVYVQVMNPFMIYQACDWLDTDQRNYDNNTTTIGAQYNTRSVVFGLNFGI